jgi:oligoribonuclease
MSGVLLWTDIETTGLDECRDAVLEIGMQATDWDLHPLDQGMRVVVRPSRWWWRRLRMSAYCRHMHTVNRLIDEVDAGGAHTFSRSEAASTVIEYIAKHSKQGLPLLAGSSVDFDRRFLRRMHFLGHSALEGVSHRIVDVSVLDEIARHRYPDVYAHRPDRTTNHRVTNCLHDSMNLYSYYQQHLLKTEGKPSMTQEHLLSTQNIKDAFVQGRLGLYTEIPVEAIARNEENFERWLSAHDAQIRAEALGLAGDNGVENGRELLNEALAEAVKEYLLYGAHPLNTEEPEPDDWVEDCDLFNITLTNGDVIDCSELADEVLDAQKRYLNGLPVMQSIPTKEVK